MSWLSPAYPVGAFSYSGGLEWAVEAGDIKDAGTLRDWLASSSRTAVASVTRYSSSTPTLPRRAQDEGRFASSPSSRARSRHRRSAISKPLPRGARSLIRRSPHGPAPRSIGWSPSGPDLSPIRSRSGLLPRVTASPLSPALDAYLHAVDRQPDFSWRPAHSARPDRRPARRWPRWNPRSRPRQGRARNAARRGRRRRVPGRHRQHAARNPVHAVVQELMMKSPHGPLRVGVGGPVGSGKTALMDALCKHLRERYEIAAITNDIYTKWDAEYLVRSGALAPERIAGVETGGCPHTAIREDASINLAAVAEMRRKFPELDLILIESGGDNLAATFSPELADLTHLRHRRRGRRQDPLQGRARHHPLRSPGHQQDRSRALRGGLTRGHGARRHAHARRAPVRDDQSAGWPGRRRDCALR